jgi:hypothetical protein
MLMYGIRAWLTIGATARPTELKPEPMTPTNLRSPAIRCIRITPSEGFDASS